MKGKATVTRSQSFKTSLLRGGKEGKHATEEKEGSQARPSHEKRGIFPEKREKEKRRNISEGALYSKRERYSLGTGGTPLPKEEKGDIYLPSEKKKKRRPRCRGRGGGDLNFYR